MFEKCFEKAFRFDFVMILVEMYTKCSEMFVWKMFNFVMIHAGMYTKCFEKILKKV